MMLEENKDEKLFFFLLGMTNFYFSMMEIKSIKCKTIFMLEF